MREYSHDGLMGLEKLPVEIRSQLNHEHIREHIPFVGRSGGTVYTLDDGRVVKEQTSNGGMWYVYYVYEDSEEYYATKYGRPQYTGATFDGWEDLRAEHRASRRAR
jgi:hypothetical protein